MTMTSWGPFVFFFSSRRRHTSCLSDWSSDVCSSDLAIGRLEVGMPRRERAQPDGGDQLALHGLEHGAEVLRREHRVEIGRASCREREYITAADPAIKRQAMSDAPDKP